MSNSFMKRTIALKYVAGLCLLSIFLSCHKRGEFEVPCKILKIAHVDRTGSGDAPNNYAGYFTYTSWGDPEKITWDVKTTGRPDLFFKYDNNRRLVRYEGLQNSMVFEFVTIYIYEGDKIVGDSSWFIGTDVNNFRGTAFTSSVSSYTYDTKGRIVKVDSQTSFGSFSGTFTYDAAGNLVRPGVVYDDKKSVLRTNAWLMLVTKDFSVNNRQVADEYNKQGLPLTYNSASLPFLNSLINEIDYNCGNRKY
jgi:hypothetical protein